MRGLALDRMEETVAWDDAGEMSDIWLDVQRAAITALGDLAAAEAIDDLLDARADEMAQDLDTVVFAALSAAESGVMEPIVGVLGTSASPDMRRLATRHLDAASDEALRLASADPDASVWRAAMTSFAGSRRDVAMSGLSDPDEEVRATALEALVTAHADAIVDDLADNVKASIPWRRPPGANCCKTAPRGR